MQTTLSLIICSFHHPPTIVLDLSYGMKHSSAFMTHNHWSVQGPSLVLSIHFSFIVYLICLNELNEYLLLVLLSVLFSAWIFSLHKWYFTFVSYFFSLRDIIVNVHLRSYVYSESLLLTYELYSKVCIHIILSIHYSRMGIQIALDW